MFTPENMVVLFIAMAGAVVVSIVYGKLYSKATVSRETHLDEKVRDLRKQVESLQSTISLLSGRIATLEKENYRLRVMMGTVGKRVRNDSDVNEIRLALERLSANEIAQLAYDSFRDVYNDFASDQSLQTRRLALMEYAENHGKIANLRAAIEGVNEAAFL